jgi:RimJ/RimL family protein N-acetyltransferase
MLAWPSRRDPIWYGQCGVRTMELQTPRLIVRPFRADDLDTLATLMANPEFMRFSLGPHTREQMQAILQKFLSWDEAGLPSPFAVILHENPGVLGYCGFLHHPEVPEEVEIDIGSIPRIGTVV